MDAKKLKECADDAALQIATMVWALKEKGFTEAQAIQLVSGMLASSKVYLPFADSIAEPTSQYKH